MEAPSSSAIRRKLQVLHTHRPSTPRLRKRCRHLPTADGDAETPAATSALPIPNTVRELFLSRMSLVDNQESGNDLV